MIGVCRIKLMYFDRWRAGLIIDTQVEATTTNLTAFLAKTCIWLSALEDLLISRLISNRIVKDVAQQLRLAT